MLMLVVASALAASAALADETQAAAGPTQSGSDATKSGGSEKAKKKKPAITFLGKVALRVIYDDNIIHYSDGDLGDFGEQFNPGKFLVQSADDFIFRPRLDFRMRTERLTGKRLEVRFVASNWFYKANDIKNNRSFNLRFKHPLFGRDYLELILYHAPEQYLRSFRDRPPNTPTSVPLEYTDFRYTSNSVNLTYWRRLSNKFRGRIALGRSERYYNQAFMENDNWEWRFGGYLDWRFHRRLKLRGEYVYSHVTARAADEIGESIENTDNGDGSYERDSYKAVLYWYPRKPIVDFLRRANLAGQYQAYYFTSALPYFEDPYHVGRKDEIYRLEITGRSRKYWGAIELEGGYRFTERTSTAAFDSDNSAIGEDKDYRDNRGWIGVEYSF
jgi:hypothetical protein